MASNFVKKLDKWCDSQWIVFLCVTATVVAVLAAVFWDVMPLGSKAGVFVAFIMAFHVLEEWKFPGGLHWFYNTSVFRPKDESLYDPTRYPMSRLTDMVTNVGLQWIPLVYAALCFFLPLSNAVALCVILLCVMELFAHTAGGVATYLWYRDKGKKTIYHTGLATSLMMFLPAAAYLIAHIAGVTATDWLWCLVLFAVMCCVCVPLTETPLKKWVRKQEPGMFAFEDAKYYMRYAIARRMSSSLRLALIKRTPSMGCDRAWLVFMYAARLAAPSRVRSSLSIELKTCRPCESLRNDLRSLRQTGNILSCRFSCLKALRAGEVGAT